MFLVNKMKYQHYRNSSKIQLNITEKGGIDTTNAYTCHDRSLLWNGTDTSIQNSGGFN